MPSFNINYGRVHFKAETGFTDTLGNTSITATGTPVATIGSGASLTPPRSAVIGDNSMIMTGVGSSILFSDSSQFAVANRGDYTVGFWFNPTTVGGWRRIFATSTAGTEGIRIYHHNGGISLYVEHAGGYLRLSGGTAPINTWTHIMIRRESGVSTMFINGVEIDNDADMNTGYDLTDTGSSVYLGTDNNGGSGVDGAIDDFFFTAEAVSFTQADFTFATAQAVSFLPTVTVATTVPGQAVVSTSGFSGTKTYIFYDSASNILQQGLSNTLNGLQASSYTVTVSDTNNNQVSTQFTISIGGNNMSLVGSQSGSAVVLSSKLQEEAGAYGGSIMVTSGLGAMSLSASLDSIGAMINNQGNAYIAADIIVADDAAADATAKANAALASAVAADAANMTAMQTYTDTAEADAIAAAVAADVVVSAAFAAADAAALAASETAATAAALLSSNARGVIQADVDANELAGDSDRALIRTEFAAADTVLGGRMDSMKLGTDAEAFTTIKLVNPQGGYKTLVVNGDGELAFA